MHECVLIASHIVCQDLDSHVDALLRMGVKTTTAIADVMWHSWLYLKDVEENTGKSSFNSRIDWDGRINVDVLSLQYRNHAKL